MNRRGDTDMQDFIDQQPGIAESIGLEPAFARVVAEFGPPPPWRREQGFPTLIRIILEQQVSLASAKAAFERLIENGGELTPARFLLFDDEQLKTIGFQLCRKAAAFSLARMIFSRSSSKSSGFRQ